MNAIALIFFAFLHWTIFSNAEDFVIHPKFVIQPKARCTCGVKNTAARIVGGKEATVNEYPWMTTFNIDGQQACGGSLINDCYILTAAHCVKGLNKNRITIDLGDHNLATSAEASQQEFKVRQIIMHPGYKPGKELNDLALLRLDECVEFNNKISPVCLPGPKPTYQEKTATATGWGTLSAGGPSPSKLREVNVPVLTNAQCKRKYTNEVITKNMLCAGRKGKDSCQGDSGGPLVYKAQSGKYLQIGITSWGYGCGSEYPGVYTRVNSYLKWIRNNSKAGASCRA